MIELTSEQKQRQRTILYLYILLALLILLVAATYTWFSISQTPRVNDMAMYINADTGIELATAYDAADDKWGQTIEFPELVTESSPLKPVTWSEKSQSFWTAGYGLDGRLTDKWRELSDEANADRNDGEGYYVVGTFYARSGQACSVSLADAVEMNEGENGSGTFVIGTPVWDAQSVLHSDGGSGAETAIRLGFKITPIDNLSGKAVGEPTFYIYEPNCDQHGSYSSGDVASGYVPTPSIDGTDTLGKNLILQTASTWSEAYPVQRDVIIKRLGSFETDTELFSLEVGDEVRIELYVWLEGQDVDCTNEIIAAQIFASVQFKVDYSQQSGLITIK